MEIKHLIGIQIKNLRKSKGMTQEGFAEKAGISSKYLSSIERGKENPTLDTLLRLFTLLDIEFTDVFNGTDRQKSREELTAFIGELLKNSDEERLKLTARIIREIYL